MPRIAGATRPAVAGLEIGGALLKDAAATAAELLRRQTVENESENPT